MVIWKTYIKGKFFRKKSNNQRVPHGVKRVRIRSYSGPHFSRIFPYSDWIRRDTPYTQRHMDIILINHSNTLVLLNTHDYLLNSNFHQRTTKRICFICFNKIPLKMMKMLFVSSKKLFPFSRYLNVSLALLTM